MPTEPAAGPSPARPVSGVRQKLRERAERVLGEPEREVTLVDAQAIRAVAHDARQRVIDVLYAEQRPYTATQLATLTGLTPSAMSYHLRALERWGVVERAEGGEDNRSRPWKAAGTSLAITGEGPGVDAAHDVLVRSTFRALAQRMRHARALPPEIRQHHVGLVSGELWLTPAQVEDLSLVVERAVVELMESGWVNEPGPDRERMAFLWSLLPDPYATAGDEPAGEEPAG